MIDAKGISRRSFLQGLAAGAVGAGAFGLAGCAPASQLDGGVDESANDVQGATVDRNDVLNPQDYGYTANSITDFASSALFSGWKLGGIELGHRMVKSAAFQLAFMKGNPDEYIGYYERMAQGGVEMIWVEDFANIWELTASPLKQDYASYDVKGLVDRLHAAGAHVGYQFDTMGSPIGPLDFEEPFLGNYSTDEVKEWEQTIIGIAKRLHDDGFDAFELNFAANNVGQSFLSRARNNRTDEYGPQSLENRTRFVVEVVKGVKEACGEDFVVQVLINGVEGNDRSLGADSMCTSIEENKAIAKMLEDAGADSLHVRLGPAGQHIAQFASELYFAVRGLEGATGFGGRFDFSRHFQGKLRADHSGCGLMLDVAAEIKSAVSIPVGAATYMDPAQAPDYFEAAISEGKLDFLVMNRPLCVDPEYVNKLREGRIDEIAPCTRCLHCFYDPDKSGALMEHCRVNAANWRAYGEAMPEGWTPAPIEGEKRVMVVGGGPAGMEAARVAAQRGCAVTLYEKGGSLGGRLAAAEGIKGPHENLGRLRSYLAKQLEVYGVNVVMGTEVDAALVEQEAPDAVIVAVGGKRAETAFEATSGTQVLSLEEVASAEMGDDVTVLGSNCQAVDVAVYLLSLGKNVSIVTPDPLEAFEKGHSVNMRDFVESAITAQGVRIWPSAEVLEVGDGQITIKSEAGVDVVLPCSALVDMSDELPNTELADSLSGIEVALVGDCAEPYNIAEAISSANLAARAL
ncbi:tat (twin-arginine translocation) pathway signal sequence [Gordonibacter sp. An230]|uniref:oxidoreductase n=1 Tax=Gordonibacter sp. An230 TaxID=1965592 RepID=UPI000B367F7B|nr:FAD-dependent oxidoreductase [Gordonibacter sp. An230]OUO87986.1 tat (twin-arginine translocation) pathway signal sequence [Gordonibacter sp. An230]